MLAEAITTLPEVRKQRIPVLKCLENVASAPQLVVDWYASIMGSLPMLIGAARWGVCDA